MTKSLLLIPCLGALALLAMSAAAPELPLEAAPVSAQAGDPGALTAPAPLAQATAAPPAPPKSARAQRKAHREARRPDGSHAQPRRHRRHRPHRHGSRATSGS